MLGTVAMYFRRAPPAQARFRADGGLTALAGSPSAAVPRKRCGSASAISRPLRDVIEGVYRSSVKAVSKRSRHSSRCR